MTDTPSQQTGNDMTKRTARKASPAPRQADGAAPGKQPWTTPALTPIDANAPRYRLARALLEKERGEGHEQ